MVDYIRLAVGGQTALSAELSCMCQRRQKLNEPRLTIVHVGRNGLFVKLTYQRIYIHLKRWGELLYLLVRHRRGEIVSWVSRDLEILPSWWSYASEDKIGIILQGPIITERDYTLRFARYYKKINPNAEIVVSTWDTKRLRRQKKKFDELGISMLLNKLPTDSGRANVNLQIVSTLSGLKHLQELGITIAIKTRTDQVLANPKFFEIFCEHLSQVKVENKIVISSFNSFCSPTLSLSDMVQFGSLDSLMEFWSLPKEQEFKKEILEDIPEVYLVKRYISKLEKTSDSKPQEYSLCKLKKYFVLVDANEIDQVWVKQSTLDIKGYWRITRRDKLLCNSLCPESP